MLSQLFTTKLLFLVCNLSSFSVFDKHTTMPGLKCGSHTMSMNKQLDIKLFVVKLI